MKTLRVHLRSGLQIFAVTSIEALNSQEVTPDLDATEIAKRLWLMPAFAIVTGAAAKYPGIVRIDDICFIGVDEQPGYEDRNGE